MPESPSTVDQALAQVARASDSRRRIDVWLHDFEFRAVDEAAERAGVETGAVARLAVIRAFHGVCRDASEGRVKLRRRSVVDKERG